MVESNTQQNASVTQPKMQSKMIGKPEQHSGALSLKQSINKWLRDPRINKSVQSI